MSSSTSSPAGRDVIDRRVLLALWTGILTGPLAWLVLLEWNYVASYVSCETRQTWFLHVAILIALIATAAAGFWGWSAGRGPRDLPEPATAPVSAETRDTRRRWMGHLAVMCSAFFFLVILAMEVPIVVLRTCQ